MNNSRYGFFILLLSAFFYASYGIFSKVIGDSFEPFTQAWTRSVVTLLLFFAYGLYRKQFTKVKIEDIKWFLVIGIVGSLALAPTFYSLSHLNLGTALFLQYAATIITSYLIGPIFLKEKLTNISYGALGLAFIGLLMVYWGDIRLDYLDQALPVLASIVAGSFFSIWFVFSKKISHKYATVQLNTYGYVFAVTVNILIASFLGESININFFSTAWLANLGYGVVGFAGSGLAVYGFKFIEAHKGSVVLLSEILFGMIFGFMLFGEVLNIITLLGGSLILIASALPHVLQLGRTEAT